MAVFRVERKKDFVVMSNHHLRNRELSLRAKGLLSLMLSLSSDWNYSVKGLSTICNEGRDSVRAVLKELEEKEYLIRKRKRLPNGRLDSVEYAIYEQPVHVEAGSIQPNMEGRGQAIPKQALPVTVNQPQLNIERNNIEESNKMIDMIDRAQRYRARIEENIDYDSLVEKYATLRVGEIVELVIETVVSDNPVCRIEGAEISRELVRNRLLKLDPFDKAQFNRDRAFKEKSASLLPKGFDEDCVDESTMIRKELICHPEAEYHSLFWWIEELSDPVLACCVKRLSESDINY